MIVYGLVIKVGNDWPHVGQPQVAMLRNCHLFSFVCVFTSYKMNKKISADMSWMKRSTTLTNIDGNNAIEQFQHSVIGASTKASFFCPKKNQCKFIQKVELPKCYSDYITYRYIQ